MGLLVGDVVVSLMSLSKKRDNVLSAYKNIDSISMTRHIFKLKSGTKKGRKEKKKRKMLTIFEIILRREKKE